MFGQTFCSKLQRLFLKVSIDLIAESPCVNIFTLKYIFLFNKIIIVKILDGKTCKLAGWGTVSKNLLFPVMPNTLYEVNHLSVLNQAQCRENYRQFGTPLPHLKVKKFGTVCAAARGKDSCIVSK